MSQPAASALAPLPFELVVEDGIPMDDHRHVIQMDLFKGVIRSLMIERGQTDYFTSGNIFVYYSIDQARDVAMGRPYFRGPDILFVDRVPVRQGRRAWVSWEEGGRLPDLIIELLSPSTEEIDRTVKKDLYAQVFRTREYYLYDFDTEKLEGFRLAGTSYQPMKPNRHGRFRSEVLGVELGLRHGVEWDQAAHWIRLFHPDGRLVASPEERAAADRQRADTERQRAEAAEAELARLRALLREVGGPS